MMFCLFAANTLFTGLNYKVLHRAVGMWSNNYGNCILFVLASVSGIGFIILLSNCFNIKILEKIGSKSIYYYGLHLLILNRLCGYMLRLPHMDNWGGALMVSILSVYITLFILDCLYIIYERLYLYITKRISASM